MLQKLKFMFQKSKRFLSSLNTATPEDQVKIVSQAHLNTYVVTFNSSDTFEFFLNSRLIRWIQQNTIYKKWET